MYKKVHLRLTALCAGITAALMVVMSLCYLYVSETGLYRNQYNSFKNDINTIATNLEQQSVISMEWLSKMEAQGNYAFLVLDNDVPFLYNSLTGNADSLKHTVLKESLDFYRQSFSIGSAPEVPPSPYASYHTEYRFSSPSSGEDYFGSVIIIEKRASVLEIAVVSPLSLLEKQIFHQRVRFFFIDLAAILLLGAFSWIFTGILLRPIAESQRRQAQFIASASHELRTPLAVILSSAECCANTGQEQKAGFLKTIKQEGLRMSRLIEDLLTLTESDGHHFSIRKKSVELDTLLLNTCEAFEALARENALSLCLALPPEPLPPCLCDPDRIRQVLSILIHNAISYTPAQGKILLSLSYRSSSCKKAPEKNVFYTEPAHEKDLRRKSAFYLSVSDNGIGISDEDRKKIFDRFYRVEKSRSTKDHFGLGLSIACEIVHAHRGSIAVADSKEGGAVFTVALPERV